VWKTSVLQVSEFLHTNETAKSGVDFISDVGTSLGNVINGIWNSITQPTPETETNNPDNKPEIHVTPNEQ